MLYLCVCMAMCAEAMCVCMRVGARVHSLQVFSAPYLRQRGDGGNLNGVVVEVYNHTRVRNGNLLGWRLDAENEWHRCLDDISQ